MSKYKYRGMTPLEYGKKSCDTLMRKFKAEDLPPKRHFHYHQGVFLSGVDHIYRLSGEAVYQQYIRDWVNSLVEEDGRLTGFDSDELDDVQPGILLFSLYEETKSERYRKPLTRLMDVVKNFPVNAEGGFWHKVKNKEQMWLDGLYMAGPFTALYGRTFEDCSCFESCIFQAKMMEEKTKDDQTGLWYHAWDSVKERPWADPVTGRSAEFWGRSIGWVPVALLDELDYIPEDFTGREELVRMVRELLPSIIKYQDDSGLWYQVTDKGGAAGNWLETSCSCLFAAAIAKAVTTGILAPHYLPAAVKAFEGVINTLKTEDQDLIISGICVGTGVGDYEHYCRRPTSENDLHGTGAFLLMCAEIEQALNR